MKYKILSLHGTCTVERFGRDFKLADAAFPERLRFDGTFSASGSGFSKEPMRFNYPADAASYLSALGSRLGDLEMIAWAQKIADDLANTK